MKVGLNILALIAILVAVAMSYPNLGKVDSLQTELSGKQNKVRNLIDSLDQAKETFAETQKNLDEAQTAKAEVSSQIEVVKSNMSAKASELGRIDAELDEQAGELASLQQLKEQIEAKLGPIQFSELPDIIAKLEQDVKDGRTENENALALIAGAEAKIASLTKDIDSVRTAIAERAARIASNAREGVILAADNEWNFVQVIGPFVKSDFLSNFTNLSTLFSKNRRSLSDHAVFL